MRKAELLAVAAFVFALVVAQLLAVQVLGETQKANAALKEDILVERALTYAYAEQLQHQRAKIPTASAPEVTPPVLMAMVSIPAASSGIWNVTAYCSCAACCGKSNGITASGVKAAQGTVAAPRGIPFGTQLTIAGYGTFTVHDRGGDIGARRLDMWFPTHAAALAFGRRNLEVSF